jgi:putative component of membrane protein insertase Oxa1/YidC/SpoIIIJ protein YidD
VPFCDCNALLRLSVLLRVAAAPVPSTGSGRAVLAALRFYRRRLTRFTPVCPSTPSCSAYAEAVVRELGPRRGLVAAADRIGRCGRPPGGLADR